jgi:hypothetical protein
MSAKAREKTETKTSKKPAAKAAAGKGKTAKPEAPAAKETTAKSAPKAPITQEMIAQRAYHLWVAAGRPNGQDAEIWRRAEAELREASGRP